MNSDKWNLMNSDKWNSLCYLLDILLQLGIMRDFKDNNWIERYLRYRE